MATINYNDPRGTYDVRTGTYTDPAGQKFSVRPQDVPLGTKKIITPSGGGRTDVTYYGGVPISIGGVPVKPDPTPTPKPVETIPKETVVDVDVTKTESITLAAEKATAGKITTEEARKFKGYTTKDLLERQNLEQAVRRGEYRKVKRGKYIEYIPIPKGTTHKESVKVTLPVKRLTPPKQPMLGTMTDEELAEPRGLQTLGLRGDEPLTEEIAKGVTLGAVMDFELVKAGLEGVKQLRESPRTIAEHLVWYRDQRFEETPIGGNITEALRGFANITVSHPAYVAAAVAAPSAIFLPFVAGRVRVPRKLSKVVTKVKTRLPVKNIYEVKKLSGIIDYGYDIAAKATKADAGDMAGAVLKDSFKKTVSKTDVKIIKTRKPPKVQPYFLRTEVEAAQQTVATKGPATIGKKEYLRIQVPEKIIKGFQPEIFRPKVKKWYHKPLLRPSKKRPTPFKYEKVDVEPVSPGAAARAEKFMTDKAYKTFLTEESPFNIFEGRPLKQKIEVLGKPSKVISGGFQPIISSKVTVPDYELMFIPTPKTLPFGEPVVDVIPKLDVERKLSFKPIRDIKPMLKQDVRKKLKMRIDVMPIQDISLKQITKRILRQEQIRAPKERLFHPPMLKIRFQPPELPKLRTPKPPPINIPILVPQGTPPKLKVPPKTRKSLSPRQFKYLPSIGGIASGLTVQAAPKGILTGLEPRFPIKGSKGKKKKL